MFCNNCGEKIEEGMKFCTNCGARIEQSNEQAIISNEKTTNHLEQYLKENLQNNNEANDEDIEINEYSKRRVRKVDKQIQNTAEENMASNKNKSKKSLLGLMLKIASIALFLFTILGWHSLLINYNYYDLANWLFMITSAQTIGLSLIMFSISNIFKK